MLTGREVTVTLHLLNQTSVYWYSKQQATVKTETFGSEFTAARIAIGSFKNHITMHGDYHAVVTNSTINHLSLNKRHALSYHRVRK
jgi:hypothetical protein